MNVKQVIVVRMDLNMRKGKIAAQVAHCAMKVFFDKLQWSIEDEGVAAIVGITSEMKSWMMGAFTKVVVGCQSEQELYDLAKKAEEAGIPTAIIIDNGFTEFHGNKTTTCVAIGPDLSEKIDLITGGLQLI